MTTIVRAQIAHVPKDPFFEESALESLDDGGLAFSDGRIVACGAFSEVSPAHPGASIVDARGSILLPEAHEMQMLAPDGYRLGPEHLLYLATGAGAQALGLSDEIGDLTPGKSADFVLVRPPEGSTLHEVLERSESVEDSLGAVFTLAHEESIAEVRVGGRVVWPRHPSLAIATTGWSG